MSQPPVRALLFDVFGTLVDWHGSLVARLGAFGRERGLSCDWHAFVLAWRGEYVPSMNAVRDGTRAWANLDELQGESLVRLLARFGLPELSESERRTVVRFWHALEPWPDVPDGLKLLHATFVTASLSNGSVELLVNLSRHGALRFDTIFSAETFRRYKPDPETYLGAAALLACAPAETMLVAAHESDLRAAASNGLRTAFVARPHEYGPAFERAAGPPDGFDLIVDSLTALAALLAGGPAGFARETSPGTR